jgi:tetratricopeptide (TPR) repeat protein
MLRGVAANRVGDHTAALADLSRVVKQAPTNWRARYFLAHSLAATGQSERALAEASEVVALRPDSHQGPFLRGITLHALGRWQEAIPEFTRCTELDAGDAGAYCHYMGQCRAELGDWKGAVADLRRAVKADPKALDYQLDLALAHLGAADDVGFRKVSENLHKLYKERSSDKGRTSRSRYDDADFGAITRLLANRPVPAGWVEDLVGCAEQLVRSAPEDALYLDTLGAACFRAGRYEEAGDRLRQAIEKN